MLKLKLEGRNLANCDFWTKSDPYLKLLRPCRIGGNLAMVRKTETVRNSLNPSWTLLYIPLSELCDADPGLVLTLEVYDEDRNSHDDLIGVARVSLVELQAAATASTPIQLRKGEKLRGEVVVSRCEVEESGTGEPGRLGESQPRPGPGYPAPGPAPPLVHQPVLPYPLEPQPLYPGLPGLSDHTAAVDHQGFVVPGGAGPVPTYSLSPHEDPTDTRPPSIWI